MIKKLLIGLSAVGALGVLVAIPLLHALLVAVNFAIHLVVLGLQLVATRWGRRLVPGEARAGQEPFVSVLVPAHNEPPEVLQETLRALAQLHWQNFEVLVIDNNTTEESLWRPVEACCRELGPRFRFLHVEGLRGAKAGAMNWAHPFMDPRAEFIFVVDADYVVEPGALRKALAYATDPAVALVQFPQEYRNIGAGNFGVALDFKHFFAGYMNLANQLGCVPSTGTLSLIRVGALRAVGGFDTQVVTEDADLGFRLNARGFRTLYAPEVVGRGLMPHDLESLKKQRWRWAFGNAQILKLNGRRLILGKELHWRQKLGYLIHLTAWFNFNLIPSITLILLAPLVWLERLHPVHPYVVVLSGFTLTSFMILRFGTMYYSLRQEGHCLRDAALAFLTHLGLGWVFSASWLKCLFDHRSPFVRTNKFISSHVPSLLRSTGVELGLGVTLLAACVVLTVYDFVIGPVAALLMSAARFLVYWVWWQTRRTWQLTVRLAEDGRRRYAQRRDARLLESSAGTMESVEI